ncbi:c-type cytochrome [Roseinatronobacter sp.]|uniref:c-type cytochrome n=1 Tax=Roseinatronobacter sp. TaxID=1945755 RepID=UPI0025D55201|nr:hypothetical protein [Roseibaca sp.]
MAPRPNPIDNMSPAEKLLRVGTFGSLAVLLILVTVRSFGDGPDRQAAPQVAEFSESAEQESTEEVSVADMSAPVTEDPAEPVETAEPTPAAEEPASTEVAQEAEPVAEETAQAEEAEAEPAPAETTEETVETAAEATPAEPEQADGLQESALLARADIDAGESAFRQCSTCHQYATERNAGGPHLVGIVGREVAAVDSWRYSTALQEAGGIWTPERLEQWLTNPNEYIPGNRMAYPGVRDEQERIDIIGFLAAQSQ